MAVADLKERLCNVFCENISVRDVPAGLAVSTAFDGIRGEPLGFYVVGPDELGRFLVQDDGRTIPFLEASGADLSSDTRKQSLKELLQEYDVQHDLETDELTAGPLGPEELPRAAMRFVATLLRIQDLDS